MKIGLIDVDSHNYPNLALMKISSYHKANGDDVEWWWGFGQYDRVYMSKVFDDTYSPDIPEPLNATEIIKGGTGYGLENELPFEIEHMCPDYSLYPDLTKDTAYGFLTRGYPNACPFCIVSGKEGQVSHKVADFESLEDHPIDSEDGKLSISLWHGGNDYFVSTRDELDEYIAQQNELKIGGM